MRIGGLTFFERFIDTTTKKQKSYEKVIFNNC